MNLLTQNVDFVNLFGHRGGYSSTIWVGMYRLDLKVDTFLYQSLLKNETHVYTRATNFKQILLKISHYFSKIAKLSSKFREFLYQIDEIGPIFTQILANFENMTHIYTSFCTE